MKRQTQVAGVRRWHADDLLELQSETFKALDGIVSAYKTPFVISGCEKQPSDGYVSPGFVALAMKGEEGLKVMPFEGYPHSGGFYIIARKSNINSVYADGVSRISAYEYEAWGVPTLPPYTPEEMPPYIEVSTPGTAIRFTDVIQDRNHRFVTDYQIEKWNAAKQGAIDSANAYSETKDTETRAFIRQVETGLHRITESLTTTKADKAETVVEVGMINEDPYKTFHESRIVFNDTGGGPSKRGTIVQFCTDRHGIAIQAHANSPHFFISNLIPSPIGVVGPPPPTMWSTYELFHTGNFNPREYMKVHTAGKVNGTTYTRYMGASSSPVWSGTTCKLSHFVGNVRYMVHVIQLDSTKSFLITVKDDDFCEIYFSALTSFEVQIITY